MPHSASLSLNISENILLTVKQIHRNADLKPMERVYLANLVLDCGKSGLSFAHRSTLAEEVKVKPSTARCIERDLKKKGYLCVFEYRATWYRSPWVQEAQRFLDSQQAKQDTVIVQEPTQPTLAINMPTQETPLQAPPVMDATPLCRDHNPPIADPMPSISRPEATPPSYEPPLKDVTKKPELNPYNGATPPHQPVHNSPKSTPQNGAAKKVTNKDINRHRPPNKSERNPYHKNRHLVRYLVDDIVDTLNIHGSWNWVAKIVWNISEEAEQHLYNAVRWVREEIHCARCHSPAGLLTWKLREDGILT